MYQQSLKDFGAIFVSLQLSLLFLRYFRMEAQFTFKADARPIQGDRPRYREDMEPTQQLCNIAVDPRIYRGSTFARRNILTEKVEKIPSYPRKIRAREYQAEDAPKEGCSHGAVQTDPFDENDIEIIKQESEVGIQTEPYQEPKIFHKKPPPLVAVGVKTNTPGNDLFDFDQQVQPFVTTLIEKALHDAQMEVEEEQELANLGRYLRAFQKTEQKEAEKVAKIEEAEAAKFAEKERIVAERLAIEAAQLEVRAKVLARGYAEYFTWDLADDVMAELRNHEYFYDEIERSVEENVMPWLFKAAGEEFRKASVPQAIIDEVFKHTNEHMEKLIQQVEDDTDSKDQNAEAERKKYLRMMLAERRIAKALTEKRAIEAKKRKANRGDEEEDEGDTES